MSMYRVPESAAGCVAVPADADDNDRESLRNPAPMRTSFAQIRSGLLPSLAAALVLALAGCASLPPPTAELAGAQQAVARADAADADQYAGQEVGDARRALGQAQAAMSSGREDEARSLALLAASAADLAAARSREAAANADLARRRAEITDLKQRLQLEATP